MNALTKIWGESREEKGVCSFTNALLFQAIRLGFFSFFLCDECEKCIYAQERTSVRGKTDVPPQCRTRSRP